jgi:ABC-2 type transport system permease protein
MKTVINRFSAPRIWALIIKELQQLKRNRRLVISLIIPPTVQIVLAGFALNAEITQLRLGVLDESRSFESRELVSSFDASGAFHVVGYYSSPEELGNAIDAGKLDAALTIPGDFARQRLRNETAELQVLIDAVNSNTATIASTYVSMIVQSIDVAAQPNITTTINNSPKIQSRIPIYLALLFNPGLEHSWFIITGILGTIVVLNGSVVASASIIKEREVGTIEQLLMTPASTSEIIIAKMSSLALLLLGQLTLGLTMGRLIFNIPVRGSLTLLMVGGMLCLAVGAALGLTIAAITYNQQQAQLLAFFINPIIGILSGALTPIEAMPKWMQTVSIFNPVRHFAMIVRGVLIKGVGVLELYPHFLALFGIMTFLLTISMWRLRKRIG